MRIWHKQVGGTHILTSPDLPGLHIGDPRLDRAFDMISPAVSVLVEAIYGIEAEYEPDVSFENLQETLDAGGKEASQQNLMIATAIMARAGSHCASHKAAF